MLTLVQLYNLGLAEHIDIFSGLSLPAGSPIDKTLLINSIIEKCGLNFPLYADPMVMMSAITIWSSKHQYTFEHIAKIMTAEYSPIENKYYTEETEFNRDLTDDTKGKTDRSEKVKADNKTENDRTESHSGTDTTEDTTSAYNSSTYEPDNKSTFTHGESITEGGSVTNSGSSDKTIGVDNSTDKTVKEHTKTKTLQRGNIGVTSNTELQLGEVDLLTRFNPYTFIGGLFENELTLFVY